MVDKKTLHSLSKKLIAKPEDHMYSFRQNVFLYIAQKDITLQEVAEMADISLSTLKSFLYGSCKDCSLSTAIKLARVFDVSIDELVGAGTISPQACKSLQTLRFLPESFTHFIRWLIQFRYQSSLMKNYSEKAVEVMKPEMGPEGNLKLTNVFELMDITDLPDNLRPKVFMGIRVPSNMYEPYYFEGNILLLANDRNPKDGERIIFSADDNLWISEYHEDASGKSFHSIRDGKKRGNDKDIQHILGYIAKVHE